MAVGEVVEQLRPNLFSLREGAEERFKQSCTAAPRWDERSLANL